MTDTYKYDETASLENSIGQIHDAWKGLRDLSSSGQKAWLTQMKNHYTKIIQADPEAAAELLATNEYHAGLIRKHG